MWLSLLWSLRLKITRLSFGDCVIGWHNLWFECFFCSHIYREKMFMRTNLLPLVHSFWNLLGRGLNPWFYFGRVFFLVIWTIFLTLDLNDLSWILVWFRLVFFFLLFLSNNVLVLQSIISMCRVNLIGMTCSRETLCTLFAYEKDS